MKRAFIDPEYSRIQSVFDLVKSECSRIQLEFDLVKSECSKKSEIISKQREKILRTNWRWRLFIFISTLLIFVFIGATIFLSHLIGWSWSLLIDIAIIHFFSDRIKAQSKRIQLSIINALSSPLSYLNEQEKSIQSKLNQAESIYHRKLDQAEAIYHQECIHYKSYPPDWEWRRKVVLERDQYKCTNCLWPQGALRRSRELHVHHIISLAKGGDNSLENLITLCNICHRKVDTHHRLVHKNSRGSWWRRY